MVEDLAKKWVPSSSSTTWIIATFKIFKNWVLQNLEVLGPYYTFIYIMLKILKHWGPHNLEELGPNTLLLFINAKILKNWVLWNVEELDPNFFYYCYVQDVEELGF